MGDAALLPRRRSRSICTGSLEIETLNVVLLEPAAEGLDEAVQIGPAIDRQGAGDVAEPGDDRHRAVAFVSEPSARVDAQVPGPGVQVVEGRRDRLWHRRLLSVTVGQRDEGTG